jgi:hypothetical protein
VRLKQLRRWNSLQTLVRALAPRQLVPLGAAIFSLFVILGPMTDVIGGGRQATAVLVINSLLGGCLAIGYAFGSMRRRWPLMAAAFVLQILWIWCARHLDERFPMLPAELAASRLRTDAMLTLIALTASYTCFLWFINGTAARYLRAQAEIGLAREIHRVLVPAVGTSAQGFEFVGFSIPSGEVGGDLVDVVQHGDRWIGYVADVSGHGVSSGVVMGMFKSAMRARLLAGGTLAQLLRDLNAVLLPMMQPSMYVTCACVQGTAGGALEFTVAGHLPLLKVAAGSARVEEITIPQIPVGMFADYAFLSDSLRLDPGDLLVLLTDGLTEVFDRQDRELGLEGAKRVIAECASMPLQTIGDRLVAVARAHGTQIDDQTVLLIRA